MMLAAHSNSDSKGNQHRGRAGLTPKRAVLIDTLHHGAGTSQGKSPNKNAQCKAEREHRMVDAA